jgi:glycosyltransferase involved in cell wall biosynthesis
MLSRPIIATAVGGNLEIIHNHQTGLLVPPRDVPALYDAMKILCEDKKLRQIIAKNARLQYEKRFQFDRIVKEEFIPLYEGDK